MAILERMIAALLNREDYPSFRNCVYLNQASLGLIGQPAVEAMQTFLEMVGRHGNLNMTDDEELAHLDGLRHKAATLLNVPQAQVAIVGGASEILGQMPYLLKPGVASEIVLVETDFPAVTRPWLQYSEHNDCRVSMVRDNPDENLTDSLIASLNDNVEVIAVANVQYATGSMIDMPRLRDAASEVGAKLLVDVTQSAGVLPVDCEVWSAEAVVCSGYKWLGGHGGVALAAMSPRLLEMPPTLPGWMGAPEPFDFDATSVRFVDNARRFTQSTLSYVSVAGLSAALDQLLATDMRAIKKHARQLAETLIRQTEPLGWLPFRNPDDPCSSSHIIAISNRSVDPARVQRELAKKRIICGCRNGRLRVSIAPYNDESDIARFIDAIAAIA